MGLMMLFIWLPLLVILARALQHRLVEREVGDDLLHSPILVLGLAQSPDLGDL